MIYQAQLEIEQTEHTALFMLLFLRFFLYFS